MADLVATNAAVSSLLETAVAYDGCQSLQSDSERTQSGERKRRTCICHIGDACQIMTTAFNTMKDPRGCFILVPFYEIQLREAYFRHLRPNSTIAESDKMEEFVVAVHHFHPTVIDRSFNTDPQDRQEDDILPMPARTTMADKTPEYLLQDADRVVNHQTGAPTGEYWVVPSYSFDATHADLKQAMGHMPQLDLERCVRRMKREARRQKWEAIVGQWEAVSKRSLPSEATKAPDAMTMPPSPSPSRTSCCTIPLDNVFLQEPQISKHHDPLLGTHEKAVSCYLGGAVGGGRSSLLGQSDTASILTAKEVLELEMDDNETVPDLSGVDEPTESTYSGFQGSSQAFLVRPTLVNEWKENVAPSLASAVEEQDNGSLSSLSVEGNSLAEERMPKAKAGLSSPQGLVVDKPNTPAKVQDHADASQVATPKSPELGHIEMAEPALAFTAKTNDQVFAPVSAAKLVQLSVFKSRIQRHFSTAIAVGFFCVYIASMGVCLRSCIHVIKSREEAFV